MSTNAFTSMVETTSVLPSAGFKAAKVNGVKINYQSQSGPRDELFLAKRNQPMFEDKYGRRYCNRFHAEVESGTVREFEHYTVTYTRLGPPAPGEPIPLQYNPAADGIIVETWVSKKNPAVVIDMAVIPGTPFPCLVSRYTVTGPLYGAVMGKDPSDKTLSLMEEQAMLYESSENGTQMRAYPVTRVNFWDAVEFCNKLSELFGREPIFEVSKDDKGTYTDVTIYDRGPDTRNGFSIPTESAWRFFGRGGEDYQYAGSNDMHKVTPTDAGDGSVHLVGTRMYNAFGLFDMTGSTWEWTSTPPGDQREEELIGFQGCPPHVENE